MHFETQQKRTLRFLPVFVLFFVLLGVGCTTNPNGTTNEVGDTTQDKPVQEDTNTNLQSPESEGREAIVPEEDDQMDDSAIKSGNEAERSAETDVQAPPSKDIQASESSNEDFTEVDPPQESTADEEPIAQPVVKTFNLGSKSFAFTSASGDNPTMRVKKGDTVVVNLSNSGGFHDWKLDGYGVGTKAISSGETTSVTFTADKAGTFKYYCSIGSHRAAGMEGTLIVE